ncbi:hypothetical protein LJB99_03650 [Deltaproteobacteria bacterium OttesenSCG-928-K17]|nr:hypothetical protein [Deltaproteobacteria bacterium OttesenSCG-928-K17]
MAIICAAASWWREHHKTAFLEVNIMDTRIFDQGLSVNAVSSYILICALRVEGGEARRSVVLTRWNAGPEELDQAVAELLELNVVSIDTQAGESDPAYIPISYHRWGRRQPWPEPKGLPVFQPREK